MSNVNRLESPHTVQRAMEVFTRVLLHLKVMPAAEREEFLDMLLAIRGQGSVDTAQNLNTQDIVDLFNRLSHRDNSTR